MEDNFLRLPQVLELIGIKKTKLWQMIKNNQFPKQKKLGATAVWSRNEIQSWIDSVNRSGGIAREVSHD